MNNKFFLIGLILLTSTLTLSGCAALNRPNQAVQTDPAVSPSAASQVTSPQPTTQTPAPTNTNFTARFEIYTNGTRRVFTNAKYHHQSPDVYLEATDPNLIQVKKDTITWGDFFETLPFFLTKECLVTGTSQTFCSSEGEKLRFFLNGQEDSVALERRIRPGDELRVTFGE
jgi:hypothetical protein